MGIRVLCLAVFLAAAVQPYVTVGVGGSAPLRLHLCSFLPLEPTRASGERVSSPFAASLIGAGAAAVEHINQRNFTSLPDGAALIGDRDVIVEYTVINIPDVKSPYLSPILVRRCSELGAHFILATPTIEMVEASSQSSAYYGIPQSSVSARSSRVSDEGSFPMFHRLCDVTTDTTHPVVQFIKRMGWRQVAIIYTADIGGEGMRTTYQVALDEAGIRHRAFATPTAHDLRSYETVVTALWDSGMKVVIDMLRVDGAATLMSAVHAVNSRRSMSSVNWLRLGHDAPKYFGYPFSAPPHMETVLSGWLRIGENLNQAALQGAMETVDLEPVLGTVQNIEGVQETLFPATYQLARLPSYSTLQLLMYDSVWTAVAALLRAEGTLQSSMNGGGPYSNHTSPASEMPEGRRALSKQAHAEIVSGRIAFAGLSGPVAFKPNGNRDLDPDRSLVLTNYVNVPGAEPALQEKVVGYFQDGGWDLYTASDADGNSPITWRNGKQYPYVPDDGSPPTLLEQRRFAILGTVLLALAIVVGFASVLVHNRRLRNRVANLQKETDADLGLDLDSPVAKMVNFLRQYQHAGTHIFAKSPTVIEAAAIEKLIFADVARLAAPDLRTQLMSLGNFTSRNREVYRHLLREYFDNGEESSVRTSQSMGSRLSVGLAGQETTPILAQDLSGHAGESNLLCPPVAKSEIARNFFLDAITDDSPLRLCLAPLAAVVEQSVACLKLKPKSDKSVAALRLYIQAIEKGYLHEGYHCLMHAADVTNHLAALLSASGIADSLLPADQPAILGAVVGAAIHDYNHPQVNNAFLVQEGSPLALEFNDFAVLEMHSIRSAFSLLLSDSKYDFMAGWSARDRKLLRASVIDSVLATEMASHFDLVGQFSTQIGQASDLAGKSGAQKWNAMNSAQKTLTLKIAMKVADLGHCYTETRQHMVWVKLLEEEFFQQGDKERAAGRQPSPLMDRNLPGVASPSSSIGFFRVIALPLISAWVDAFPECKPMLDQAENNAASWEVASDSQSANLVLVPQQPPPLHVPPV